MSFLLSMHDVRCCLPPPTMNLKSLLLLPVVAITQLVSAAPASAQLIAYESFRRDACRQWISRVRYHRDWLD
jgi:hypothetical protein